MEVTIKKEILPLRTRIITGVLLLLFFGVLFGFYYMFWNGMSYWTGMKEDMSKPDQFYIRYVWGFETIVLLIIPTIVTIMDSRIIWKVVSWIFSVILFMLGWMGWMILIS